MVAHLSITGSTGGVNNITATRVSDFIGYYETDLRGPQLRYDELSVDEDAILLGNVMAITAMARTAMRRRRAMGCYANPLRAMWSTRFGMRVRPACIVRFSQALAPTPCPKR
jgi:hypothetical protein